MSKATKPAIQSHPDYHDGYFEAVNGCPLHDGMSDEYEAGWKAGRYAKDMLIDGGFKQDGRTFSKTTVIKA